MNDMIMVVNEVNPSSIVFRWEWRVCAIYLGMSIVNAVVQSDCRFSTLVVIEQTVVMEIWTSRDQGDVIAFILLAKQQCK